MSWSIIINLDWRNDKIEGFEECESKYNRFLKITSSDYLKTVPLYENETIEVINHKGNKDKILLIHIRPSINTIIRNIKDEVYEGYVSSITFYNDSNQYRIYAKETNRFIGAYLRECDFRKTVFLTKSEAEAKLEELRGNNE